MLVSDLVSAGFRIAGVLPVAGRGYSLSEGADALRTLNSLVDAWKAERLLVFAILRNEFVVVANQEVYTIGPTGNWAIERPEKIEAAGFIYTNTNPPLEQPLTILSDQEWEAMMLKKLPSTIANYLYYRPILPNGQIYLWPIPSQAWKVALYTWQNVNQFAALTDTVVIPPAYQQMIEYWLAIHLAARYPLQAKIAAISYQIAKDVKAFVKAINTPSIKMITELGSGSANNDTRGHWSIFSNSYIPTI